MENPSIAKYLEIKKKKEAEKIDIKMLKSYKEKNNPVANYIKPLASNVFAHFEKHYWADKIKGHKNYIMFSADRAMMLREKDMEWRTNFKTPLTRIFTDSLFNRLFDSTFDIDVYSLTPDGAKESQDGRKPKDSVNALNEWAYLSSDIDYQMKLAMKDGVTTGDGFWRVDMRTSDGLKHFIAESAKDKEKPYSKWIPLTDVSAVIEYIPREEIIYEAKKNFYESSFVGRRRIEPHEKFMDRWGHLIELSKSVEDYIYNTKNAEPIFSKDYSRFRRLKDFEANLLHNHFGFIEDDLYTLDPNDIKDHGESYEHWTSDTLTIFRNGHVVYDGPNPMGINMHPFVHFGLGIAPNMGSNSGITQLLVGIQELYDLVYNGYADYLKRHFNPMFMATGGQWLEGFDKGYLDREPYKIIKNLGDGKVEKIDLADDILNGFSMLDQLRAMASQITGVTRYTGSGAGEGVERSARASDYQVQITLEVLKPIVFSIGKALNRTSKIWSELAKTKLPPKSIVSIMGKDGAEVFKKISLEDLNNDYVIRYRSDSISDYLKQKEIENINSFLSYENILGNDPVTETFIFDQRKIAEKVAELHGLDGAVLTVDSFKKLQKERIEAVMEVQKDIQEDARNSAEEAESAASTIAEATQAEFNPQAEVTSPIQPVIIDDETAM